MTLKIMNHNIKNNSLIFVKLFDYIFNVEIKNI